MRRRARDCVYQAEIAYRQARRRVLPCRYSDSTTRFHDLRKSPRFEVHYPGQIDLGRAAPSVNCIICDISATGAKLTVGAHQVPDEFILVLKPPLPGGAA